METYILDVGNRQVKMMNSYVTKVYPSYYLDSEELGNESVLSKFKNPSKTKEYISSQDELFTYVWGNNLEVNNVEVIDTISFEKRYSNLRFKVLIDMTLGELALSSKDDYGNEITVSCIIGVPTNDYLQENVLLEVSKSLKGRHETIINNEHFVVDVEDIYILPQSLGTLFHVMLDNQGNIIDHSFTDGSVAVVDIGGGTVLLDLISNMRLDEKVREQLNSGSFTLFDAIQNDLVKLGYAISIPEIERLLRTNKAIYEWFPNSATKVDITDIVMKHRIRFTRRISNKVKTTYKNFGRMNKILITGGGSNLLIKEEFIKDVPNAHFVKNPEVANLKGFKKYAIAQGISYGNN